MAVGGRAGDADADLGSARGDTRIALVPVRETRGNRRRGGASPVVETNGDCGTGAEVGVDSGAVVLPSESVWGVTQTSACRRGGVGGVTEAHVFAARAAC